ncbi:MAG: GNAT family N-acetyltransferase [Candidatus Eisenbacteria bacterium]
MDPIRTAIDSLPLSTARLRLRSVERSDTSFFFDLYSNEDVMRYWSTVPMTDRFQAEEWVENAIRYHERGQAIAFVVTKTQDGSPIGYCSLHSWHFESRRAELGYALAREHWGAGYMHEALSAVVELAFEQLGLHRLEADVEPANAASVRALERLGFVREGHLRERWIVGGAITDSWIYGLLEDEWRSRKS